MNQLSQMLLTVLIAVIASSGFWAFLSKKVDNKSAVSQMLLGLAHDRIIQLGLEYIERGWITRDEHENLTKYLYKPYTCLGGNSTADRIIYEVNNLAIRRSPLSPLDS